MSDYFCRWRQESMKPKQLEQLVKAYQGQVYRYLRYLGVDIASAEDFTQETFLAVMGASQILELEDSARAAYIRRIARNLYLTSRRQDKRKSVSLDDVALIDRAELLWREEFLRKADGFDYLQALRQCRQNLPARQNEFLQLQYAHRKTRNELAEHFNMSAEGAKTLGRRIRQALRSCVHSKLRLEEK